MPAPHAASPLRYRPDIDGLRALAILPVVLFHYRIAGFSGGFVGVDVFFVISGYLITALIAGEMDQGRFSLAGFYMRRIRRIFPALFAMLVVVSAAAYFILFPFDLVRYANSLSATALFAANFEFWREAGYFDVSANQKPLLHLWSIAVEEQFYLLFPAFLLALGARRNWRKAGVALVLVLSFGFSMWAVFNARDAAFYLLPSRAWELMLGALLALGAVPPLRHAWARESTALAGVALIALSVFALRPEMPFPGALALLPCLGTALVIHAGSASETATSRLLAWRPVVFIGLISYSLYLWHWPVFVLARYVVFRPLLLQERVALMAVSAVLAVLAWQFVEKPLRRSGMRWQLFPAAATAMAVSFVCGATVAAGGGLPQRLSPGVQRILAEEEDHEPRIGECFPLTATDVEAGRMCAIGAQSGTPSFLLWGDSHADAILPAVSNVARSAGRKGLLAGGASCAPLMDVTTWMPSCRPFNDAVIEVALRPEITEVILEARWAKYAEGATWGDEPHGHVVLKDAQALGPPSPDNHAVFLRGLERTVQALAGAGKKVVIVGDAPEIGWPVPAILARRALAGEKLDIAASENAFRERQRFVFEAFADMHRRYGAVLVYPDRALCMDGKCAVALNGIPLYRDEHHLSVYGALQIEPLLAGML